MSIPIKKIILLLLIPIGAPTGCNGTRISQDNGTNNNNNKEWHKRSISSSRRNNTAEVTKHTTKTSNPNTENEKPDLSVKTINNENHNEKENINNIDTDSESDVENDDQPIKRRKKERIKIWNKLKNFFKKKGNQKEDYED